MIFRLGIYHPDRNENILFENYDDYKKWRGNDIYRYGKNFGGCCYYTYYTEDTKNKVEGSIKRQVRYWNNKEIENLQSKKWRIEKKIRLLKELNNE